MSNKPYQESSGTNYQALDPSELLAQIAFGDVRNTISTKASDYSDEKLISGYINSLFSSIDDTSVFLMNVINEIRNYVSNFDEVEPPPFDTYFQELSFLDASGAIIATVNVSESGSLSIRSGPSKDSEKQGSLKKGEQVKIIGYEGDWAKIEREDGSIAYVSREYLDVDLNNQSSIGPTTNNANAKVENAAGESAASTIESTETNPKTNSNPTEDGSNANQTEGTPSKETYYVNTKETNLNVRSGAGTDSKIIGRISRGSELKVIGQDENGWTKIEYNGQEAYVKTEYISQEPPTGLANSATAATQNNAGSNLHSTGSVSNHNSNQGSSSETTYYVNTRNNNLNFRSGAGTDSKIIGSIPKGSELKVIGQDENGWTKVEYNGQEGYVFSQYVGSNK